MDLTLNYPAIFPEGTSVGAYPKSNWPASERHPAGAPLGSADDTQTVEADGDIPFTGLTAETEYWAVGQVSGTYYYVRFLTAIPPTSLEDVAANGKGFVNHVADADVARPTGFASIEWLGSVEPNNAADGDSWIDTSS